MRCPRHSRRGRGGVAVEVDGPAAVGAAGRRRADPARRRPPPGRRGAGRAAGKGAKSSGRMNSSSAPPATCSRPFAGTCRPQPSDELGRLRGSGRDRVEELRGEGQLHRVRLGAEVAHGGQAERRSPAPARGARRPRGRRRDAVRRRRHDGGDLQRRLRAVGSGPERGARRGIGHRQGERQSAVGIASPRPASRRARRPARCATGATSANASNACSAPPGWLVRDRRSGSRPQP